MDEMPYKLDAINSCVIIYFRTLRQSFVPLRCHPHCFPLYFCHRTVCINKNALILLLFSGASAFASYH